MYHSYTSFEGDFLTPSEDNFSTLLGKIDQLHSHVLEQATTHVPRLPGARFDYTKLPFTVPRQGSGSDEVLAELAGAFRGSIRWHQPTTLMNITPNPLLDTVAATTLASLYNVNALWDYPSGAVLAYEKQVIHFLSYLAGWESGLTDGLSVSGGKATIMYALKCGLNACDKATISTGLQSEYVVIASATAHYSIEDCCNYVGIGRANVIRVAVDASGAMDVDAFEEALRGAIAGGKKVAAIIALGGDTLEHAIDPIKHIHTIRTTVAKELALGYIPYLHLDSVNAWIGLTFRDYNFGNNPLQLQGEALSRIQALQQRICEVSWADSFGADFHKTGLTPYASSFFIAKDGGRIRSINTTRGRGSAAGTVFGELHVHHYSFENSRPANGILSAWTSMKRLGITGYQQYWARLVEQGTSMRKLISQKYSDELCVLNQTALGHPNVVLIQPSGASYTYEMLLADVGKREQYASYCFGLYDFMAYQLLSSYRPYPLLGFIPAYGYEMTGTGIPAFLIYANHPNLSDTQCDELLRMIVEMKHAFEHQREGASNSARSSAPQRIPK